MWLFNDYGFSDAFRVAHVISAVMWMGLLWFFNFVQVPAYAEMDAAVRNSALDKLTWRALWWFRWAAVATVGFGLLVIAVFPDGYDGDYFQSSRGIALLTAIVMALVMLYNVWMVIWPNQQVVIGNARNLIAGGEANPDAAAAARKAAMASRQNTIFSFPVLFLMVGAAHIFSTGDFDFDPGGTGWLFFLIGVAIVAVLEANALGYVSGTGNGGLNVIYETHKNAMYTGFGIIVVLYILAEILMGN